ncbi:flippase [Methanomethylovorans sp.]|uniref:flippase n=1 Tax=Methanomethylovorans sp. TaxID=2758717 RepID=UPI003D0BC7BA
MFLNDIYSRILSVREVQRQTIASFLSQISVTFAGFLSTMYFAHTVGSGVLGAYFLFLAYYGIINTVSDGGFGGAVSKRISEGEQQNEYFSAFFVVRFFFLAIVILFLVISRDYFIDFDKANLFNWLLLALIVSLIHGSVINGIAGTGKMGIYAAGAFINNISRIIIQVVGVFFGYGVAGLIGGFVAGLLIAVIMELRFFDLRFVKYKWSHVKSLLSFSFWLFLTSSGVILYSYVDSVMIGYYLSNSEVGVYRVVFQFTSIAIITTTAIRATLWPKISRWDKIGEMELIEKSISKAFTYSLIIAMPVFAGGIVLGEKLLYFCYGSEFESGYLTLVILLFVQIINVSQFFYTMYLSALDRQIDSFKVTAVATIANVALNAILIPFIGIEGAAVATLVTMGLNAILAKKLLSKIITIRIERDSLLNILKAASIMTLFVAGYRVILPLSNVWLTLIPVVVGGSMYGILLLKFDKKICDELKEIFTQTSVPWPSWL